MHYDNIFLRLWRYIPSIIWDLRKQILNDLSVPGWEEKHLESTTEVQGGHINWVQVNVVQVRSGKKGWRASHSRKLDACHCIYLIRHQACIWGWWTSNCLLDYSYTNRLKFNINHISQAIHMYHAFSRAHSRFPTPHVYLAYAFISASWNQSQPYAFCSS